MSDNKIKKFMCAMLSSIMIISALPSAIRAEENVDTVSNEYYAISGETADGILNAIVTDKIGSENIRAYIAEYDGEMLVKLEMKTELQTGENRIIYPLNDKTDVVKIFLWKDEMTPVIDAFKKEVNTSPSATPTASPSATATPTISPSPTPSITPTTAPDNKKTAQITIKYVDEENNKLKDDVVLSEKYSEGETYTIPENLKTDFTVKTEDGYYNLYTINEGTSQLSEQFAPEMTLLLTFNSTVQYDFYEDFENYTIDTSKWHKKDSSNPDPTLENDNTKYIKYTTGSSTTGTYTTFDEVDTTKKTVKITADVKFTAPTGSNKGNSQFAISNTAPSFGGNNINWGIITSGSHADGHIIGLEYNGGSTFYVNGETADTEFLNDWIHLEADADFSKKTVKITLSNDASKNAVYETSFYSSNLESNIGSIYLRSGGENGSVSVDNLTVKITGNAGPVVPNIESPINHKSVYAFGDSIVYGHKTANKSFMRLIANDYAIQLNMMAKNGATVMPSTNQILNQIINAPDEAPDFVIFDGYTNDAYGSAENDSFNSEGKNKDVTKCYGEITAKGTTEFDTDTFCGAFEQTIYTMKQKWQTSKFVFVTIHKSGARDMEIQTKLHDLSVAICEKWGVEVVDMFTDSTLDTTNAAQMEKYMIDGKGSHPNEAACKEFYIPAVVDKLEDLCGVETTPSPSSSPTASPSPSPTMSPTPTPNIVATYKFDFGNNIAADGYTAVTSDMIYDMSKTDAQEGYCGMLGTTETSFADDVLSYNMDNRAIDGFSLVKGQKITLSSGGADSSTDADSDYISVPEKVNYIPADASDYEGRYPIRFSMKADRASYYTVTATLTNSSTTENACVSLFSEKRQIVAEDVTIKPNEKIAFKFSVDIEDVYNKIYKQIFKDDMLNISVSGKNAAISSLIVEKHGKTDGTIKGEQVEGGVNDGTTMWLCTDSTGCDYGATVPFFALQTYAGSGQAFVKYMPENIAVSNQGERGLATVDNAHFNQCMLKPGDYLLVQYGHNENDGVDVYYKNLSKYYDMAEKSGAKLIIASPVNRHQDASLVDGVWKSDFTSIIAKAEQFVKEKIDAGKTNIAFVDLNTLYVDWMNTETARIKEINSSLDEQGAMSFYYRSVKGSKVDGTHMNDAGADQAAYCFFKAAKNIVTAAESDTADKYTQAQAEVVRPIVEGMKTKVGDSEIDNLPMTVSDEIINAGKAPNTYWDTEVAADVEYKNSVAVDSAETTSNDDSFTLSAVTVRLMNTIDTYVKAVVTVTNNGEKTKYYTESNYDFTGAETGAVLTNSGFITSDKDKNDVSAGDKCAAITIPNGASCTIQVVSCDDNWAVGDNPTVYSTVYTVHPDNEVILSEDGSAINDWTDVTSGESFSKTVTEDADGKYMSISLPKTDKAYPALYKQLNKELSKGRYKLSFVTRLNEGTLRIALAKSVGTANNPLTEKTYMTILDNGKLYSYDDKNSIPTIENEEGTKEGKFNIGQWVNVECIFDLDVCKEYISVAGSDYAEFDIADWQNAKTLPIKYLAIAGSSSGVATAADIKNIKLAEITQGDLPQKNVTVNVADATRGSVTINGENISTKQVDISSAVTLKATPAEGYKFISWTDEGGNILSTSVEYTISRLQSDLTVTANFEAVSANEISWNFAEYANENAVTASADGTFAYEKGGETLTVALKANDQITDGGIVWANKTLRAQTDKVSGRYIEYTPSKNGKLTVTFQGSVVGNYKPRMYIASNVTVGTTTKANLDNFPTTQKSQTDASAANTDTTVSFDVTAGTTYHIFSYCYNKDAVKFTIPNITFTPTSE